MKAKGADSVNESSHGKRALTPRLRFPEFRYKAEWDLRALGSVLGYERPDKYIVAEAIYKSDGIPVLTANKSFILGYTSERIGVYDSVPAIIFDDFTTDKKYVDFPFKVKSSAIKILSKTGDNDLRLIFASMTGIRFNAREHKRYWISEYQKIRVPLPGPDEQQKIADSLASIDEMIGAESRKLGALKAYKKGLMQQLFPAEGETVPRLRFPEFREASEWRSGTIGELFEMSSGGTPDRSKKEYWNGVIPWVTTSLVDFSRICKADEYISEEGLKSSSAKTFPAGTVLIAMYGQGKTRGKVSILDCEAATNQACAAVLPEKKVLPDFVFLNLVSRYDEIRALSNSGGQENLSQSLIKDLRFSYPENVAEQARVTGFLSRLNELITAQSQRIDALKAHKKGLMQQLFPVLDEVHG